MLERALIAGIVIVAGVGAYRLLLFTQHWRATRGAAVLAPAPPGRASLLIFTSPTCAPCKLQQIPIVDRMMREWSEQVDVKIIDVTEQPEVAADFGVWSVPTTIVLDAARRVVAINQGVAGEPKLRAQFERAVRPEEEDGSYSI